MTAGEALTVAWPFIAVTGIVAWWLVWAIDIPDGYQKILRFVLATAAVIIVGQILLGALDKMIDRKLTSFAGETRLGFPARIAAYRRLIRSATQLIVVARTVLVLL